MVSLSCGFSYSGAIFAETFSYDPARRHNRLRGVHDVVAGSLTCDLPSQMAHETASPNYTYDASGNLTSDTQGGLLFTGAYTALY